MPQATASMKYQIYTFHLAMKMARISPRNADDSYRDNVGHTLSLRWSIRGDTVMIMIQYGCGTLRYNTVPVGTVTVQYGLGRYGTSRYDTGTVQYGNTDY